MPTAPSRFKFVYLRFAMVFFAMIIADAFFYNWTVLDHFEYSGNFDSQVFPLAVIVILLLIFFRPRMMLFTEAIHKKALFIVAVLCIFIPVMFLEAYLATASGKLTTLQNIGDIRYAKDATMYYSVHDFYAAKSYTSRVETTTFKGKNHEETDYDEYYAVPVFASAADTLHGVPFAWLGFNYQETVNTSDPEEYKRTVLQNFQIASSRKINSLPLQSIKSMRRIYGEDLLRFYNAIDSNSRIPRVSSRLVLSASLVTYKERNGNKLLYFIIAALVCLWITAAYVGSGKYDEKALQNYLDKGRKL